METTTETPFHFTMSYAKSKDNKGYFGFVNEVPGAASQADTVDNLKTNLLDAIKCIFESNRKEKNDNSTLDKSYTNAVLI